MEIAIRTGECVSAAVGGLRSFDKLHKKLDQTVIGFAGLNRECAGVGRTISLG